ncbi:MAG: membrane protein insertion efficiency factor YidD [Nocardioidaceae bacterium]|nr:membrane protein insertion efficiency factor YidD [Nocardioidaceae bacterium]
MTWLLMKLVRGYQLIISPYLGASCRYYPSCSAYAIEALRVHGALKGVWLAARRLGRCHPWSPGGVDHVPPRAGATSPVSPSTSSPQPASAGRSLPQQGA